MRAPDGSTFDVQWFFVDEGNPVLELATPYRSMVNDDYRPFDMGYVGEIPVLYPARGNPPTVPTEVCKTCRVGLDEWWTDGWPSGTPGVTLRPDGFAEGCVNPVPPVTSVGLALPPEFTVSGSPVTGIGVLSGDWVPVPAGYVLSGPVSGPDAAPTFKPGPSPGLTIPFAKMAYAAGTSLFGFPLWGAYRVQAGDTILTWDGVSAATWGIWVAAAGSWTRDPSFPAGVTFSGPAYVWVADEFFFFSDQATLVTLAPLWSSATPPPGTWTVGVDDVRMEYAAPVSTVGAGSLILVTPIVGPANQTLYVVDYTGPTTLDQWATLGGPISTVNIDAGTLPPGVMLPATQLTGTASPGNLPSLDSIAGASGDLSASNVGSGYPYSELAGAPGPSGAQCATLSQVTTGTKTTIWTASYPVGLRGWIVLHNPGDLTGGAILWTFDWTDVWGRTGSGSIVQTVNGYTGYDLQAIPGTSGIGSGYLLKSITVSVQWNQSPFNNTAKGYVIYDGC